LPDGLLNEGNIMFTEAIARTVEAARPDQLDHLAKDIYQALAAGTLNDAGASAALEAVQARRVALRSVPAPARPSALRPPARPRQPRSPERQRSIERRRRMVGSIALPPPLAVKFTWGEVAALRVIGNEVKRQGFCDLHVDAIAAMAGMRRTTVQNALRQARRHGLITVEERRVPGRRKNLPNIIRITSPEWMTWLRKGPRAWSQMAVPGCGSNKNSSTTNTESQNTNQTGLGASWYRHFEHYDPNAPSTGRWGP
jgi:hypothetical protein